MLAIGPIQLDLPAVQAALAGYSDAAMRRLAGEYGCPLSITEAVLDQAVLLRTWTVPVSALRRD